MGLTGSAGGKAVSASRRTLALAEEVLRLRAVAVDLQGQLSEQAFTANQLRLQLSDAEQQVLLISVVRCAPLSLRCSRPKQGRLLRKVLPGCRSRAWRQAAKSGMPPALRLPQYHLLHDNKTVPHLRFLQASGVGKAVCVLLQQHALHTSASDPMALIGSACNLPSCSTSGGSLVAGFQPRPGELPTHHDAE